MVISTEQQHWYLEGRVHRDLGGDAEEGPDRVPLRLGLHRGRTHPRSRRTHHCRSRVRLYRPDQQVLSCSKNLIYFFFFQRSMLSYTL